MKTKRTLQVLMTLLFVSFFTYAQDHSGATKWMTFEQAVAAAKKEPRPIMIDIYTQWCGPCKLMTKNTFNNEKIAEYLNKNFYCVKFDAECFDTVKLDTYIKDTIRENGKVVRVEDKPFTVKFANSAAPGTPKSPHQFAYSILDGKLLYPSIVFLGPNINRLEIKTGYHTPELFEPIIHYYGSGAYKTKTYDDFLKEFKTQF